MAIQFAAFTSATAPYLRVLKFANRVPSLAAVPAMVTPVPLIGAEFSPDGKGLIAWTGAAGSVTPFRYFTIDGNYTFTEVQLTPLTIAGTIGEVKWCDDGRIVVADSVNGGWHGIINRATGEVTWSRFNTETLFTTVGFMDIARTVIVLAGRAATPFIRFYQRAGDTYTTATVTTRAPAGYTAAAITINYQITKLRYDPASRTFYSLRPNTTNGAPVTVIGTDGVLPSWINGGGLTYVFANTATFVYGPAATTSYIASGARFSPSGKKMTYSIQNSGDATFYLRMVELAGQNGAYWPKTYCRCQPLSPVFPSYLTDVAFIGNLNGDPTSILLTAVNSTTQTTGRVRGFVCSDAYTDVPVEIPDVATLFNDWAAIVNYIAVGPELSFGIAASVYDAAVAAMVLNTVHLSNLKLALVSSAAQFNSSHTTLTQALAGAEVYGSSWPQGGIAANVASYDEGMTDTALVVSIPAMALTDPGSLTFRGAILYDDLDADKMPIAYISFTADQNAAQYDSLTFSAPNNRLVSFKASN